MKYEIFTGNTPRELQEKVQQRLEQGWTCEGGVGVAICVADTSRSRYTAAYFYVYAQAMTKSEGDRERG